MDGLFNSGFWSPVPARSGKQPAKPEALPEVTWVAQTPRKADKPVVEVKKAATPATKTKFKAPTTPALTKAAQALAKAKEAAALASEISRKKAPTELVVRVKMRVFSTLGLILNNMNTNFNGLIANPEDKSMGGLVDLDPPTLLFLLNSDNLPVKNEQ